jgi:hypothetical protein
MSCLPRASGGVSAPTFNRNSGRPSSPREWGCFQGSVELNGF